MSMDGRDPESAPWNPDVKQDQASPGDRLFEELALPCLDDLYRVACRLERDPERAEDLLQQALLVGFQKFRQLRKQESFRPWFVSILRRTYLNRLRTATRETSLDEATLAVDFSIGGDAFDPELRFLTSRLRAELRAALDGLPDEQRLAVYLVDVEGFKYADAAEALEVPPGTVASRVARGRRSLQKSLMHLARERGWAVK